MKPVKQKVIKVKGDTAARRLVQKASDCHKKKLQVQYKIQQQQYDFNEGIVFAPIGKKITY